MRHLSKALRRRLAAFPLNIRNDNDRPMLGKFTGNGGTNPLRAAGNQGDLIGQPSNRAHRVKLLCGIAIPLHRGLYISANLPQLCTISWKQNPRRQQIQYLSASAIGKMYRRSERGNDLLA
jgi:hypothetical protein